MRVADRRIDLPRDLGDRDPVGDGQVELDVEAVAEVDGDPRLGQPEPAEEPVERAAGEARDAVRAERRGPDEVDHGATRDERSAGSGLGRHAGEVLVG